MSILVVDDVKSVQLVLRAIFDRYLGVVMTSRMNGHEGFEELQGGNKFDLVLCDWKMPVLNGLEIVVRLRATGITTPVIMMSTKSGGDDLQKPFDSGVAEYLTKPFTAENLIEKISKTVGRTNFYAG